MHQFMYFEFDTTFDMYALLEVRLSYGAVGLKALRQRLHWNIPVLLQCLSGGASSTCEPCLATLANQVIK